MRKLFVAIVAVILLSGSNVYADTFTQSSSFHFYAGGYANQQHWTQYDANASVTCVSGIKMANRSVETSSGLRRSKVISNYRAGSYDAHVHSGYNR